MDISIDFQGFPAMLRRPLQSSMSKTIINEAKTTTHLNKLKRIGTLQVKAQRSKQSVQDGIFATIVLLNASGGFLYPAALYVGRPEIAQQNVSAGPPSPLF